MIEGVEVRSIMQSDLTEECWLVQVWGLKKCQTCPTRNTAECGGKEIRKTGKNRKGFSVPLKNHKGGI